MEIYESGVHMIEYIRLEYPGIAPMCIDFEAYRPALSYEPANNTTVVTLAPWQLEEWGRTNTTSVELLKSVIFYGNPDEVHDLFNDIELALGSVVMTKCFGRYDTYERPRIGALPQPTGFYLRYVKSGLVGEIEGVFKGDSVTIKHTDESDYSSPDWFNFYNSVHVARDFGQGVDFRKNHEAINAFHEEGVFGDYPNVQQLILHSNDVTLLTNAMLEHGGLFRRDQIWFASKQTIYSLDDFEDVNTDAEPKGIDPMIWYIQGLFT